ncbi:MAG: peptidoglycan-binding protein [Saprospiraceae bacterium]|nr:peptidoglycan-binding protein [Saprospiraceae bacterium]
MKRFNILFAVAFLFFAVAAVAQPQDTPANAEPGKCYAKCMIPDEYETVTERIKVKDASTRVETIPAEYETVTEQALDKAAGTRIEVVPAEFEEAEERIMTKAASVRIETIPAEYETVSEQALKKAAGTRLIPVPAEYATETERKEIAPATTKWVKRRADKNCLSANPDDCLVWCLVEVPAQYETITKTVLKTPATTKTVEIPAEYQTVTKQVVKNPAQTRQIDIPAEYKTVKKLVVKTPAQTRTIEIPAEYKTVSIRKLTKKGGFSEWREVLCPKDVDAKITQIQIALRDRGYNPGPIDNIFGAQTKAALIKFQKSSGLPVGQLDKETLKALGVE